MDRNKYVVQCRKMLGVVALRKESVDRNYLRRGRACNWQDVALRKESVDRNGAMQIVIIVVGTSLSARRAWIEIETVAKLNANGYGRSPQGERG